MTTENTITRPNFFILLELDPNATWDPAKFESALRDKRNEWSKQSSSIGPKSLKAKQYLSMIPEMTRVMSDAALRTNEENSARAMLNVQIKARKEAFQKQLTFLNAARSITKAELDKFIQEFQDIYSPDVIKAMIKVPVQSDASAPTVPQPLDPSKAKRIAGLLEVVNKQSLYDVLQLSDKTGVKELHEAAEKLYQDMGRRMPKTTEVTVTAELAGLALEIFQSEEMRKRYDESIRQAGLDNLLKDVDDLMSRSISKRLDPEQVTLFLEDAQKSGWKQEDALSKLEEHSLQHRFTVRPPGAGELKPKMKCGNCGVLNAEENKKCTGCGIDLYIDCPNCGQRVTTEQQACGNCGFLVGNRFKVNKELKELDEQLKTMYEEPEQESLARVGELDEIKKMLGNLENIWPAQKPNELSQKIKTAKEQVGTIERAQEKAKKSVSLKLNEFIDQKRFFAAQELLEKKGEVVPPQEKREKQQIISERIAKAESIMKEVQAPNLSPDEKIVKLRAVLHVCADYQDAQDMLKQSPISPARDVQAQKGWGNTPSVNISWRASTTPDVTYTIARKVKTRPASAKDGKSLGTISGLTFEDTEPVIGRPLFYTVFAGFESAISDEAAHLAEPIMFTAEASHVKTQAKDRQIELSWDNPANTEAVLVMRHTTEHPKSMQDGTRVPLKNATDTHALDSNLINGQTYYYGIYCQFKDHRDRFVSARGVFVSAIPVNPPFVPPLKVEVEKKGEKVEIKISWGTIDRGEVAVLKSAARLGGPEGQAVPENDLNNYGQVLRPRPDGCVIDSWDRAVYYTPAVIFQGIAYIGTSQHFIHREGLKNVECHNEDDGSAIYFTWVWPNNCDIVKIVYKDDDFPVAFDDARATERSVNRLQYSRDNGFYLRGVQQQSYYIKLFAIIKDAGEEYPVESGQFERKQQKKKRISYKIERKGFGQKKFYLCLSGDLGGYNPEMELRGKQGTPETQHRERGELIKTIEPLHLPVGTTKYPPIDLGSNFAPNTYGYLFIKDTRDLESVIIDHPELKNLRLD